MKLTNAIISLFLTLGFISGVSAGPTKIPASEHVKYIYSAGDKRDYSKVIQKNQKKYAKARGVQYKFVDLENPKSSIIKTLAGKQKYWAKIVILQTAMNSKKVPEGSWVAWADDDITFNDINHNRAMMDRVIDEYGEGKSLIVASEESDWAYLNTGIILVKKDAAGRQVLAKLMEKSDKHHFGYKSQAEHSFHEQGALKELFLGENGVLDKDDDGTPFKEYIARVPQRDGDLNFNTFRRVSHRDEARKMNLEYNDGTAAKARDTDAFIHHTGMEKKLRAQMIDATLKQIEWETSARMNPFSTTCPALTEEQLHEAREIRRLEEEKQRFVLVSPIQSQEELLKQQKQDRETARNLARAKSKKWREDKRKTEKEEEKIKAKAEAEANARAEAEQKRLYNTLLTAQLKEDAETSIQGLQSLGSASSMMMLTTLTGLSSVMSSYRSGRAFSFGMASIDDVPTLEMLASTAPSARSPVISRETGSWHNFVQLHMMRGNRNSVNGMQGGSSNGQGLSAGVFYQLSPEMIAGMMLSVSKNSMNFNQGGNGKVSSVSVGPFMSYTQGDWHIDGALSVSRDNYELKRKGITGSELKSDFPGSTLTGYLATGYDIHLDHWTQGLTLTPMAELMLIHSRHGSYQEKGNRNETLKVKSASNNQVISRLGVEVGYLFPNLEKPTEIKTRFGVQHQTMSAQNTGYQLPTGTMGQITVPAMSERSLFTGVGIQRQLGEHSKVSLNYNGTHSANGNSHGFQLEFEKKF